MTFRKVSFDGSRVGSCRSRRRASLIFQEYSELSSRLDLKLHDDVICTDHGSFASARRGAARPARSIYQWQFRAATENTVIRARGWGRGREEVEGVDGAPFSGEFLGW